MSGPARRLAMAQWDVFSSRPLEGNSLAVFFDGRGLSDAEMQSIAKEMNLSETTFILPGDAAVETERGVRVRIFTVQEELPFAGHPTLGTAFALRGQTGTREVKLNLHVGTVPVRFEDGGGRPTFAEMTQVDPTFGAAHTDLARSLEHVGRAEEAIKEFVRGTTGPDGLPRPSSGLAILYARAGRLDDARATLEAVQELSQKQFVSPYGIASYYAVIGDNDRALDWLEKAYSERDGTLVWLKVHPRLDGLRGEPRFRDLLARMQLDS